MRIWKIFPLLLLLSFLLAACRGASETEVDATAPPAETSVPTQQPQANTPRPSPVASGTLASCTVVSQPDNSEIEELFPPVSEEDWVKGPADARVTIMEYSDFQ
jgi:hypothetical protein